MLISSAHLQDKNHAMLFLQRDLTLMSRNRFATQGCHGRLESCMIVALIPLRCCIHTWERHSLTYALFACASVINYIHFCRYVYIYTFVCVFVCFLGKSWRDFGCRHPANFILPTARTKLFFVRRSPTFGQTRWVMAQTPEFVIFVGSFLAELGATGHISPSECWGTVRAVGNRK